MTWTNRLLWLIYLALLLVLFPHTAWAFGMYEPDGWQGLGWVGALAFEGAIAALTWRLKQAIEGTRRVRGWHRFSARYLNVYSAGLLAAVAVSSAANWAHAVEFGRTFAVFGDYSINPNVYAVAFGGILPLCSLLFARILADAPLTGGETNPEMDAANAQIGDLRRQLRQTEHDRTIAEARANDAEQRFAAAGELFALLFGEEKRRRILAARQTWPRLPVSAIAIMTDTSRSYVSEVLSLEETIGTDADAH